MSGLGAGEAKVPPPVPNRKEQALAAAKRALAEADRLEKDGDLRGAFVACQAVLIDHSAHLPEELLARIHLTMGRISIAQDKPERARKYLDKAAALRPSLSGLSDLRSHLQPGSPQAEPAPVPAEPAPVPAEPVPVPAEPVPVPVKPEAVPTDPESVPTEPEPVPTEPEPVPAGAAAPKPPAPMVAPQPAPIAIARPSVQGRLAWVASFWSRALAFGLDFLLVCGLMIGMLALGAVVLDLTSRDILEAIAGGFSSLLLVVALLVGLLLVYLGVFTRFGGQTLGKMLFGLRVVRQDGHSVKTWGTVRRLMGMLLAGLPGLAGFVWAAFDLNRRGWHDRVAGTLVVRIRPPRSAVETSEEVPAVEPAAASRGV